MIKEKVAKYTSIAIFILLVFWIGSIFSVSDYSSYLEKHNSNYFANAVHYHNFSNAYEQEISMNA